MPPPLKRAAVGIRNDLPQILQCHTNRDLHGCSHLCYALSQGLIQDETFTRRKGGCASQSLPLVMPPTRALPNLKILPQHLDGSDLATTSGWIRSSHTGRSLGKQKIPPQKWKNPPSRSRILFYNLPHLKQKKFGGRSFPCWPAVINPFFVSLMWCVLC